MKGKKPITISFTTGEDKMDATVLTAHDELIREYCREFMEKVFYFCLKKTRSTDEAEDLCSDISLAVISALKKDVEIRHFAAWVWQIAKNRYRVWALKKHRSSELYVRTEDDVEVPDDTMGVEEGVILEEDLRLLRRELAFISCDYREIVVRFYIEDLSVKDIAAALSLPEGTVKTRLYRARNILKEGMNMAREFGPKSYNPEKVDFSVSGPQPSGLPWSQVQRRVQRNILLEAANNPSTIEELSIALGIAVPYMEDEVRTLVWATLLKKVGDKYVTNFPMVSKEAQELGYEVKKKYLEQRADTLDRLSDELIPVIRGMGAARTPRITDNDIKWWTCAHSSILSERAVNFSRASDPPVRENGEKWGFIGQEDANTPGYFISDNWSVSANGWLNVHTPHFCEIAQYGHKLPAISKLNVFIEILKAGKKKSELSPAEVDIISSMYPIARFEHDGTVVTDVLTFESAAHDGCAFDDDKNDPILGILETMPVFEELGKLDMKIFDEYMEIYKNEGNSYVQEQLGYVVASESMTDAETLRCLMESGRLVYPENPENSTCTAALWIKN